MKTYYFRTQLDGAKPCENGDTSYSFCIELMNSGRGVRRADVKTLEESVVGCLVDALDTNSGNKYVFKVKSDADRPTAYKETKKVFRQQLEYVVSLAVEHSKQILERSTERQMQASLSGPEIAE